MTAFVQFVFWLSAVFIVYTYAGYPFLLYLVAKFKTKPIRKVSQEPTVSVILAAFNEEKHIEKKLLNLLNLEYPEERIEILIGSDGASDQTNEIVSKFRSHRVRFFRFIDNRGKPSVLNALVQEARHEILLFTDARQELDRGAVGALTANFFDTEVGCVSGELIFRKADEGGVSQGMNRYWSYEKQLRKWESNVGSMIGATGAIYAIRRRLYTQVPVDMLVDDMFIPLAIVQKGYRAVFEPAAQAFDEPSREAKQELTRKIRTLAGNFQIFKLFSGLFNPVSSPVAWQFFSHKFLRLMIPYFLILVFAVNLVLLSFPFYRFTLGVQAVFYGIAALESFGKNKKGIGYIPYTFCLLNFSAVIALIRYLKRETKAAWEKAYA